MKNNQRRGLPAFTLIELMAVITIIVILAGLVVGGLGYVNETQARKKAQVQIALLSKALEEYKMEMGFYPETGNEADPARANGVILYKKLFYEGYEYTTAETPPTTTDPNDPLATKIFLADLNPVTSKQGWVDAKTTMPPLSAITELKDPWGNPYRYRSAKRRNGTVNSNASNPDFDLWSAGKDGKTNGSPTSGGLSDKVNKDDIRNF